MNNLSQDKNLAPLGKTIHGIVKELYATIEQKDIQRISKLVSSDVFVFGAAAEAVSVGRDQFIKDLQNMFDRVENTELKLNSTGILVGLCDSGGSAWFFDRSVIEITRDQEILFSYPVRITGLLAKDQDWQLAAAFWSIPLRDNDYQYDLIVKGKIKTGTPTGESVSPEAQPLAQSIINAMAQPLTMPDLYSTRKDAFTIGSTVDEVFHAEDGKNWVGEIVQLPLKFAVRGGIRGAVSPDGDTAWMATHIDLTGGITMPYRFFYIWLREQGEWKIVVSHDAVSIDPANPGFEAP